MDHFDRRIGRAFFRERVGHQKDSHTANLAQCLPPLFPILDPVLNRQVQGVEKHTGGHLKTKAVMLALVAEVLGLVPCETWFCHNEM